MPRKSTKRVKRHPKCVPPKGVRMLHVRNPKTGRWKELPWGDFDFEPKPAEVFFGMVGVDGDVKVWVAECDCKIHAECPASKGLDKACELFEGFVLLERVPPAKLKGRK